MPRKDKAANRIVAALIALMQEKPYGEITATDISARAGVSRMAFYRNFSSKEEIITRYIDTVGRQVSESVAGTAGLKEYFEALFRLLGRYSTMIKEVCAAHLGELILAYLNKRLFSTPIRANMLAIDKYRLRFFAGAFYNVLVEWICSGMGESAESMPGLCCAMITD